MMEGIGHLTGHMATHIAAMNVAAPLVALALRRLVPCDPDARRWPGLGLLVALQLALLWAWHIPSVFNFATHSPPLMAAMHASLFAAALAFWLAVVDAAARSPWHSMGALLLTGKIVCLLGVLLTFADRPLYMMPHGGAGMPITLEDQQLAGLLMLIACPLTYVFGATFVAARWLGRMDGAETAGSGSGRG